MTKKLMTVFLLTAAFVSLMFGMVEPVFAQAGGSAPSSEEVNRGHGYGVKLNSNAVDGTGYGPGTCDADCDRKPPLDGSGNKYGAVYNNAGSGDGTGLVNQEEWVTYTGTVESVEPTIWTIVLDDGTIIEIYGRTLSFLKEQGFTVDTGDSLNLTGFYHDDVFGLSTIEDITTGENVPLRDENSRPLWAGNRRGGWSD
jgi:hypothetical protein